MPLPDYAGVVKLANTAVLKTADPVRGLVGSNPTTRMTNNAPR